MADRKISDLTALTTPAAGDYLPIIDISESLAANKNKRITIEELLRGAPDGTAAAPGIAFESDPDTGLYSTGANAVAISTGGTGRLFVDASGNVGLGSSSPSVFGSSSSLVVQKNGTGESAAVNILGSSTGSSLIRFADGTATASERNAGSIIVNHNDGSMAFGLQDTERLRITSTGQIQSAGLGSAASPAISFTTDTNTGIYSPGADQVAISTNGTGRLFVDASGRVGIGTTPSTYLVDAQTSAGNAQIHLKSGGDLAQLLLISTDLAGNSQINFGDDGSLNIGLLRYAHADNSLQFHVNSAERLRITADGKLGLGTSSPGYRFHVVSADTTTPGFFQISDITTTLGNSFNTIHRTGNDGDNRYSLSAWQVQNTSGLTQRAFIGARAVTGAANYNPLMVFGTTTGNGTYDTRMVIDGSGRVGVGSSSPGAKLTVQDGANAAGAILVGADYDGTGLTNNSTKLAPIHMPHYTNAEEKIRLIAGYSDASQSIVSIGGGTGSANAVTKVQIYTAANTTTTAGTAAITVDSSQRVGVGTTSPGRNLHVAAPSGSGNATFAVERTDATTAALVIGAESNIIKISARETSASSAAGRDIQFESGPLATARITSSGQLLVGTSSTLAGATDSFLQIRGNSSGSQFAGKVALATEVAVGSIVSGTDLGAIYFGNAANGIGGLIECKGDAQWSTTGSGDYPGRLVFSTTADGASSPTERMRLNSNGYFYHLGPDFAATFQTAVGAGTTYALITGGHTATSISSVPNACFRVWSNGDVVNTNNSYGAISDIKLKENIVDANSQWSDIKALQVRKYNFKQETGQQTHTQLGLIAQEVELVSPGLVSESPDRDEDGNDLGTVTKSVNYSVLYMKAVKALQEAMERIETLEAKVAALEAQ